MQGETVKKRVCFKDKIKCFRKE